MSDPLDMDAAEDVLPEDERYHEGEQSVVDYRYQEDLTRRMNEQMELRAACIENGDDAAKFLNSRFGQYLLGQADLLAELARLKLEDVDPDDRKEIMRLQNIIKRNRDFSTWVISAIEKGNAEYSEYLEEQQGRA